MFLGKNCQFCECVLTHLNWRETYNRRICKQCRLEQAKKTRKGRDQRNAARIQADPKRRTMKKLLDIVEKDADVSQKRAAHIAQVTQGVVDVFGGIKEFAKYFKECCDQAKDNGQLHVAARLLMGVVSMTKEATKYDDVYAADRMVNREDMNREISDAIRTMITPEVLHNLAEEAGLRIYIEGHDPTGDDDDVGSGYEDHAA